MSRINNKKGSAILTAIGLGVVLTIVIIALQMFTSHRVNVVVNEGKRVKALAIAEAGLELILGELYNNSNFTTHEIKEDLTWGNSLEDDKHIVKQEVDNNILKKLEIKDNVYYGEFYDGSSFKVKVGNIPIEDNLNTKTIDESLSYLKVESLGEYDGTVRRVEAFLNRRYPAREFLMYDGGVCSLVFGSTGDELGVNINTNTFSVGHLYGHKGIEIGQIAMSKHYNTSPGSKQALTQMTAIMSGDGGIYFYSDTEAQFINPDTGEEEFKGTIKANTSYPTSGSYTKEGKKEDEGALPDQLLDNPPEIPEEVKKWVIDKADGESLSPKEPNFEEYQKYAKESEGMFISDSSNSDKIVTYAMPKNWLEDGKTSLKAAYLDFGNAIHEGNINKNNFPKNGYIYSDKDIVIKGNPPSTVNIVSEKNIFIAGDFNQSNAGNPDKYKYGFPQKYKNNPMDPDYDESIVKLLKDDREQEDRSKRYHQSATIIAKERIVYDYRSIIDCFENELFPYLQYKLAAELSDEASARELLKEGNPTITLKSESEEDLSNKLTEFFSSEKYELSSIDEIKEDFKTQFNSSKDIKLEDFTKLTKKVWSEYTKEYNGSDSTKGKMNSYKGLQKLLDELRNNEFKCNGSTQNLKNASEDYLYFPEVTVDAMLISCGKLNNTFYAGPDVHKYYNKIGNRNEQGISNLHSPKMTFVHRMFGSEVNMRINDVHRIDRFNGNIFSYGPPTRRKIYDESLPTLGLEDSKIEIASFLILQWTDTGATKDDFDSF